MKQYYTYIVECSDRTFYTGWTTDVEHRLAAHNGLVPGGAKYTRGRRPVRLVWQRTFTSAVEAMREEYRIKQLSRQEKEKLIHSG